MHLAYKQTVLVAISYVSFTSNVGVPTNFIGASLWFVGAVAESISVISLSAG